MTASDYVFTNLLLVGPFVASAFERPRRTAVVAIFAVVLGTVVGAPPWVSALEHVVRVSLLAGMGSLAVWLAHLRVQRERSLVRVQEVADLAQEAIQHTLPAHVGPVALGGRYRSADDVAKLGGDLYAAVETPHGVFRGARRRRRTSWTQPPRACRWVSEVRARWTGSISP